MRVLALTHVERRFALLLAPVAIIAAGCGASNLAEVSGTIKRNDGTPLAGATVQARSEQNGNRGTGLTDEQGYFELTSRETGGGLPAGEYYVMIREFLGTEDNRLPATIPMKYAGRRSGISFTVEPGEKEVLNLTLDPG